MMRVDPYASGVLHPEVHDRLVKDLDHFARDAHIAPKWICTPAAIDQQTSRVSLAIDARHP